MQKPSRTADNRQPSLAVCGTLLSLAALAFGGCSRADYRLRADAQAYEIIAEKSDDPRWSLPYFDLMPDPRSRFFDPYDPDCPPLPPDDPAAHDYMHCVYGMRGWRHWDEFGETLHVENPDWPIYLGGTELEHDDSRLPPIDGLALEQAVELGLVNSREYQEQLEEAYLTALSLTFQRYRFDCRPRGFLGEPGTELFVEHDAEEGGMLGIGPTNLGFSKLLPSGAQLIAELTNNTLWLFSGSGKAHTATSLAFSLVQPLMSGAAREVVLEKLTQAERNALYAVRQFARFRKDFYVMVVTGSRSIPLPGDSGRGELAFLIRGERSPTVGFYHLLYLLQRVRNEESNVATLQARLRELRLQEVAGEVNALDVTQLQSSLERSRGNLLLRLRGYENELDRFKVQLGLPPDMEIEIDDSLLEPFRFRNPRLADLESRATRFRDAAAALPADADEKRLRRAAEQLSDLHDELADELKRVQKSFEQLEDILPQRVDALDENGSAELDGALTADLEIFAEIRRRCESVGETVERLEEQLKQDAIEPAARRNLAASVAAAGTSAARIARKLNGLASVLKVELITLVPVELTPREVVSLALDNRLDLMNRRGFVMDARRRIEVAADRLEATLDLVVEGQLNTPPVFENTRPFGFRADESDFRAGLSFVTPLDRRAQRNDYRAALVAYQRARRNYMTAKDQVKLDVRRHLRRLKMEARFFEISRRALRVAAKELEQAIERGERNGAGPDGDTQQGLNIPRALGNILNAQDQLIETWVDYETARLKLARDTGIMQIDESGTWPEAEQAKLSASSLHAAEPGGETPR